MAQNSSGDKNTAYISTYLSPPETETTKDYDFHSAPSSQNSITTCSTASLTDDDSDVYEKRQAKEERRRSSKSKKEKRSGSELIPPKKSTLIQFETRWDERSNFPGEEDYMYAGVRRKNRDVAPVCPVRRYD